MIAATGDLRQQLLAGMNHEQRLNALVMVALETGRRFAANTNALTVAEKNRFRRLTTKSGMTPSKARKYILMTREARARRRLAAQ